jgi:hypothetical protein
VKMSDEIIDVSGHHITGVIDPGNSIDKSD